MRGRKRLTASLLLGATLVVACAGSATGDACLALNSRCIPSLPEVALDARFWPVKLPKREFAPIHLKLRGAIGTADGSQPPALEQMVVEADKNVRLDTRGLVVCRPVTLEADVPSSCRRARVGKGEMEFEIAYPESTPFFVKSHAVIFYGGKRNGVPTVFIHAYIPNPVSAAVVIGVKITRVHHGRYGTKLVATIPLISGGYGSIKSFNFGLFREFAYKRGKRSFLSARCADKNLQAHMEFSFREGPTLTPTSLFPCTPMGRRADTSSRP